MLPIRVTSTICTTSPIRESWFQCRGTHFDTPTLAHIPSLLAGFADASLRGWGSTYTYLPDPVTFTDSAAYSQWRLSQLDADILIPKFALSAKKPLDGVTGIPAGTLVVQADLSVSIHPQHIYI
ncbi:hypothetical protein EDC04DRAFT_2817902 [Pisolithus marmoratus]|nr:hypothetical protein EDC04DRAFT_2817902 [Pisolithus marmoratus]